MDDELRHKLGSLFDKYATKWVYIDHMDECISREGFVRAAQELLEWREERAGAQA